MNSLSLELEGILQELEHRSKAFRREKFTDSFELKQLRQLVILQYMMLTNFVLPLQLSSDRGESSLVNVSETDSGALDLSSGSRDRDNMKSRSSVASHISHHSSSYQSEGKDVF